MSYNQPPAHFIHLENCHDALHEEGGHLAVDDGQSQAVGPCSGPASLLVEPTQQVSVKEGGAATDEGRDLDVDKHSQQALEDET
jgi:hypothetical protein